MYTKISGEFDSVEFAESAARQIKERIDGQKKIVIRHNKNKFREFTGNNIEFAASAENPTMIYSYCTHSNNFMSGLTSRRRYASQENELLGIHSVKMDVICDELNKEKIVQFMLSYGGYDIKS